VPAYDRFSRGVVLERPSGFASEVPFVRNLEKPRDHDTSNFAATTSKSRHRQRRTSSAVTSRQQQKTHRATQKRDEKLETGEARMEHLLILGLQRSELLGSFCAKS